MKKWLAGIVFTVSIILLSISIYSLMGMFGEEKKDQEGYEKLQSIMEDAGNTESEDTDDEVKVNEGLLALHKENPDCIAWINIEDTAIDYPVMYRPQEKNYYLMLAAMCVMSAGGITAYANVDEAAVAQAEAEAQQTEAVVTEEPVIDRSEPFSQPGNGEVVDEFKESKSKDFYTIRTENNQIFYMVIDHKFLFCAASRDGAWRTCHRKQSVWKAGSNSKSKRGSYPCRAAKGSR